MAASWCLGASRARMQEDVARCRAATASTCSARIIQSPRVACRVIQSALARRASSRARAWRVIQSAPGASRVVQSPRVACHPECPWRAACHPERLPPRRVSSRLLPSLASRVIQSARTSLPEGARNEREGSPVRLAGCCQGHVSLRRRSFALIQDGIGQRGLGALDDTRRARGALDDTPRVGSGRHAPRQGRFG